MRGLTWQVVCLVFLATDSLVISTVFSTLIPTPKTPLRFQLGTYFGQSFYVVRYDQTTGRLVFDIPGNSNCYFLKQSWAERISGVVSSTLYISLQLQLNSGLSLPTANDYYLTRESQLSLKAFAKGTPFLSSASDIRIFKSTCCCCGDYLAISTIYWGSQPYSVLTASSSQTLTLVSDATTTLCTSSGLMLYTYPSVTATPIGSGGDTGPTGPIGPTGQEGQKGATGDTGGVTTCPSGPIVILTNNSGYTSSTTTGTQYQGIIGPLGEAGSVGSDGPVGESGDSGSTGVTGVTGSTGVPAICYAGQQGPTGPTGSTGEGNSKGAQNSKGPTGAAGPKGDSSSFEGVAGIVRPTVDLSSSVVTGKGSDYVQLVVDYGLERRYVVHVAGTSTRLAGYSRSCGDSDTAFQYQLYSTYAITPSGELVKVSSFTLFHLKTKTYLAADVSSTGELQIQSGRSGLSFVKQSEFALTQDGQPDYRFFVQYAVELPDGRTVRTFCSLFFRNYCLWPAATCKLSLRPVQTGYNFTTSTLADPDNGDLLSFYDRARREAHSVSIPAISFNKVTLIYV